MSDETKCPGCGAEEGDYNQFRYQRFMACGTSLNAVQGGWEVCHQSDRCRITQLEQQLAEKDAEIERVIEEILAMRCEMTIFDTVESMSEAAASMREAIADRLRALLPTQPKEPTHDD